MIAPLSSTEKDRVLVLTSTSKDGPQVLSALESAHIPAKLCQDMRELCREMESGVGAIVLTEESLDSGSTTELIEAISHQPPWSAIPVLLLGLNGKRPKWPQTELRRLHAIAKPVLVDRPVHVREFLTIAQEELRGRQRQYELHDLMMSLEESHRQVSRLNKELEQRVAERTSELQTMIGELQSFSYTVSHDLRAPLRAVTSLSQVLVEDYSGKTLDETGQDFLRRIAAAAHRMDTLIIDLLAYSRLTTADLKLQSLEPADILGQVLEGMRDEIREKGATVQLSPSQANIMGDRVLLSQALTNLISNAIKFVAPGVPPRVTVRTEALDGRVRVWVEDNGIGIPAAYQDRVFRFLERLHQDYPGTGIGLAIVRRAVERMGGTVGVVSSEGKGSRFWIELPKG
jgi:signal transduction histidine kinase